MGQLVVEAQNCEFDRPGQWEVPAAIDIRSVVLPEHCCSLYSAHLVDLIHVLEEKWLYHHKLALGKSLYF